MKLEEYRTIVQGARSRRIGLDFEDVIDLACRGYKKDGTAYIEKTPEPVKVLNRTDRYGRFNAVFEKRGQPDYKGTLCNGRAICFEAKATEKDRILQTRVQEHQAEALNIHEKMKAVVFILVCFNRENYYRIPWKYWKNMKEVFGRKYVKEDDLKKFKVPYDFGTGRLMFILPGDLSER